MRSCAAGQGPEEETAANVDEAGLVKREQAILALIGSLLTDWTHPAHTRACTDVAGALSYLLSALCPFLGSGGHNLLSLTDGGQVIGPGELIQPLQLNSTHIYRMCLCEPPHSAL